MNVQPQFRSPLVWDVFAVSTYFTVSLLFWFVGLLPDLATLRDGAKRPPVKALYGALSMGWRSSARHWNHWESACLLLAGLATPLVLSVHTVVSFDFTIAIVPGWHSTFFPPYFVAGAIYSGFAMVLALGIPMRSAFHLKGLITDKHLDNCGKVMLATGLIVAYAYILETFTAWYSGSVFEMQAFWNRMTGPYAGYYWFLLTCNIAAPQALGSSALGKAHSGFFVLSIIVLTGMWLERFVIIVSSLAQDFLPSSWGFFHPTRWDVATYVGTLGFFTLAFVLFVRLLPAISMNEVRTLLPEARVKHESANVE